MKNIKYINKNMDLNNILKLITPEMIGAVAPLLTESLINSEPKKTTKDETTRDKTTNDETTNDETNTNEKKEPVQDDLVIVDDMIRKIIPIMLKTVFKLDPTLETLVRETLQQIDEEREDTVEKKSSFSFPDFLNYATGGDFVDDIKSSFENKDKSDIAEKMGDYLTSKAVNEIKTDNNTLITDYFKSKGSVSPPKQSSFEDKSEEDITFIKYYSEDKDGNVIPDELLNVYAFCRNKPDNYPDVKINEWNHIFSLKSMMYASINTDDEDAIPYLARLLEIMLTRNELLEFYSYLERLAKPRSPVQEIVTGLYFNILGCDGRLY